MSALTSFSCYTHSSYKAITTVGYGEITPRSILGRLVTLPLLVFGLLLIALPSFVLGREFSIVWEKMSYKVCCSSKAILLSLLIPVCN